MDNLKAYKEWKGLFNKNVSDVWQQESIPVLKSLSMLLFSIKKEIKKIEDEVDLDVLKLRKMVTEIPRGDVLRSQSSEITNNKENIQVKNTEISSSQLGNMSGSIIVDSPEMFQNVEPALIRPNDSAGSIIISDDETVNTFIKESPEIKKKRRNTSQKRSQRWHRLKNDNTSTMNLLRGLNTHKDTSYSSQEVSLHNDEGNKQRILMDDKSSMDFLRGLISHTPVPLDCNKEKDNNDQKIKESNLILTPVRSDCDVSVVQGTPAQVSLLRKRDKTSSYVSKKRYKRQKDTTTLTQIFSRHKDRKCEEKRIRLQETNYDSDETHFDAIQGTKTSQTGSLMGISRIVSYLNTESPIKEQNDTLPENVSPGIINLDPNTQEIADFVEDIRYEDFEDDNDGSLNSAIVEEDEDEEAVPQKLNDFLANVQNVPKYQLEAEPVVRGKARQKLPGWSCKDCEKFYLKQNLNPEEILALNKCSRHRGYYRPREDTLPGFWDMNMVTQETENTK